MSRYPADLTIEDVLADPMILAMRRADHVDAAGFETLLRSKARVLAVTSPEPGRRSVSAALPPAHLCARRLVGLGRAGSVPAGSYRPW